MTFAKIPMSEILVQNSTYQTNKLRLRLLREGYKNWVCENCGNTRWQGLPIPLEVDHKNGDNMDHRLENLQLLCPNCHAQTINYRGRNHGNAVKKHPYHK